MTRHAEDLRLKLTEVRAAIAEAQDELQRSPPGSAERSRSELSAILEEGAAWCSDADRILETDDEEAHVSHLRAGEDLQSALTAARLPEGKTG